MSRRIVWKTYESGSDDIPTPRSGEAQSVNPSSPPPVQDDIPNPRSGEAWSVNPPSPPPVQDDIPNLRSGEAKSLNPSSSSPVKVDGYFDRLLKYIPADVVGLWLTGSGVIKSQAGDGSRVGLLWLLFVAGLVFSFFWTDRQTKEPGKPMAWQQILLACGSFLVWVFAIGGPFAELSFYQPVYGSLLLLVYTTAIPFFPPPRTLE